MKYHNKVSKNLQVFWGNIFVECKVGLTWSWQKFCLVAFGLMVMPDEP
jgi:hypothetical protein